MNFMLWTPLAFVLSVFAVWMVYDYVAPKFIFLPHTLNFFEVMSAMLVIKLVK